MVHPPRIVSVGRALPPHRYEQEELIAAFLAHWGDRVHNTARLERLHRNVLVGGRNLALPMEAYPRLRSFGEANDAWIRVALEVGGDAVRDALEQGGVAPTEVDAIWFTTVTGLATPSIDARLVNRLGLNRHIRRTPIFGLGCVAGAAGVARVADYLAGHPDHAALLLSVELCSLTLQREDFSIPNLISTGLFGDGAAAVLLAGPEHPAAQRAQGPEVVASRSVFYPDTERVMGWDISERGFRIVLSAEVPDMVRRHLRHDATAFLAEHGLALEDIRSYVCHPGGPRVLEAFQETLDLPDDALELTWRSLREVGNLSSSSVLFVLADTLRERRPPAGSWGLMLAMGPAFCSELVLLRW